MIAACPKCAARYRIEREKIGEAGVRLRCSRCESIFRVRAPVAEAAPTRAPAPEIAAPVAAPPPAPRPEVASQPVPQESSAPAEAPLQNAPSEPLSVLVAIPDVDLAKQTAQLMSDKGAPSIAVFDGVDAMMEIQRRVPKAVVLAADLPKMFGFQICEVLKRNESLQSIKVVLAGAVHHPDRYKREPAELYGADSYVEMPDLPDALLPILVGWGLIEESASAPAPTPAPSQNANPFGAAGNDLGLGSGPDIGGLDFGADPAPPAAAPAPEVPASAPAEAPGLGASDLFDLGDGGGDANAVSEPGGGMDLGMSFDFEEPAAAPDVAPAPAEPTPPPTPMATAPVPEPAPAPAPAPAAQPVAASPATSEARAQAERLARIIVSDIVLYNEEKFAAAIANGNVVTALGAELDEGRGLFASRVDADIRADTDFLADELNRVARARGMK